MAKRLFPLADLGFLIIRLGAGLMLASLHGWSKVAAAYGHFAHGQDWPMIGMVASLGFPFAPFFAACSAAAEFLGGLLLAAGWYTRQVAIVVAINMAVAVYRHLTTDMRFELAALYLLVAIGFVILPPGRFSLDTWLARRQV